MNHYMRFSAGVLLLALAPTIAANNPPATAPTEKKTAATAKANTPAAFQPPTATDQSLAKSGATARPIASKPTYANQSFVCKKDDDSVWPIVTSVIGLLISALTLIILRRQTNIAGQQVELMQEQSAIVHKQLLIAGRQTDILEKQKEIARLEFLATHRPKIRVRHFDVLIENDVGLDAFSPACQDVSWSLEMVNVGDGAVRNIRIAYAAKWSIDAREALYHFKTQHEYIPLINIDIPPGKSIRQLFPKAANCDGIELMQKAVHGKFYVIGRITYTDDQGIERSTGFCRFCSQSERSLANEFTEDTETDYEYED